MPFKLIREAQAQSRLGNHASLAKTVQTILGEDSITSVAKFFIEGFDTHEYQVVPNDYNNWMKAIEDEATDRKADLSKKTNFEDLAHLVFENDPRCDELELDDKTKQQIVATMWASFKASKAHSNVQASVNGSIARAREEEEQSAAPQMSKDGTMKTNPYPRGSMRHKVWNEVNQCAEEEEELHSDEEIMGDDVPSLELDDEHDEHDDRQECIDNIDVRLIDLENRVDDIETDEKDEPWHDHSDEEVEDEEVAKQNMFRQVITSPRKDMSKAIKDVESDGKKAWATLQLPENPHPKKSQAHNAWMKGMRHSARESLGLVDKVYTTPAKKSSRK